MENHVIKKMFKGVLPVLLLSSQTGLASDDMFNKMEAGGAFEKIRNNMIASCYIRNDTVPQKIDIESLKASFPNRVADCSCFEKELGKIGNKTIFDDSRYAYQLQMDKREAMKANDKVRVKEIVGKEKNFTPFMMTITNKCNLK